MLKQKFANNFTSVKKAFLALDITRDGYIQEEEILRFVGALELDYTDLKKLIMDKLFGEDEKPPADGEQAPEGEAPPEEEKDIEDQLKDEARKRLKDLLGG